MIGDLRADWRKLRHRWMPRVLIVILLAIVVLVMFGLSSRPRFRGELPDPNGLVVALSLAAAFAAFVWPVLAGSWSGGEYSQGTVRLSLLRRPSRIAFSLSGLIVVLLTAGVALLLVLAAGGITGSVVAAATHTSAATVPGVNAGSVVVKLFFTAWFVSAFYAVLAYTAGVVFRSAPAGIGIGIGFAVAQSAVSAIFSALGDPWSTIAQHLPSAYTEALTSRVASELVTSGPIGRVAPTAAATSTSIIGLAIYIGILVAIMLVSVVRRDVTS